MWKSLVLFIFILSGTVGYTQTKDVFEIARNGKLSQIKELYRQNNAIIDDVNSTKATPLILAAYHGNREVALFLSDKVKDINYNSGQGTALMAAVMSGDLKIIQRLIALHANLNLKDQQNKTALMYAVYFNKNEVALFLIKANADKNLKDNEGRTALDTAKLNNNTQLIIALDK